MDQEFIDAAKSSRAERMRELGNHVDVSGSVGGAAARITARNGDVRALRVFFSDFLCLFLKSLLLFTTTLLFL